MGSKYQAEKRVEHVAIACEPDMIKPTPKDPPLPFVTYAEFDTAVNVADNTAANQYPAFVSVSKVPTCKGGPPGGKGVKSGTWNGQFVPTEWSPSVLAGPGNQVYHGHKGTINNGNAKAEVYTAVATGAPSSPCIAALQVQFERIKRKLAAEASSDPLQFGKDMAGGAWEAVKGYGDAAGSIWDGIKSVASAVWNDPLGSARKLAESADAAVRAAAGAVTQVGELGLAIANGELSVDDMMDGLQDLVSELGDEAACALAKMLQDTADAPGGAAEAVGGLTAEAAIQLGLALASGGAGNAAAASAKAAKAGASAGKGMQALAGMGNKLRAMGIKSGDSLKDIFTRLKARRAARAGNKPDASPPKPGRNSEPPAGGTPTQTHNKGKGEGEAKRPCPICPGAGGPVNPVQGCKVLSGDEDLDFVLPGLVPLHWQRSYASNSNTVSWYGQGWSVPFTLALHLADLGNAVDFIDAFGRVIAFPGLAVGREFYSDSESITLRRDGPQAYRIIAADGSQVVFDQAVGPLLLCSAVQDVQQRGHRLYYRPPQGGNPPEPRHLLAQGGQVLALRFDDCGMHAGQPARRLVEVCLLGDASGDAANPLRRHVDSQAPFDERCQQLHRLLADDALPERSGTQLVRYTYTASGDLDTVTTPSTDDRASQEPNRRFGWQDHIMVRHERPGGWTMHYDYDRLDPQGKVVHHWQTIDQAGAEQARRDWHFDYAGSSTRVTEAPGSPDERTTTYHFDDRQRWTGTTDALGQRTTFELNRAGQVTAVVDPAGRRTEYLLDGRGRMLQVLNANGERSSIIWHATLERPLEITDAMGGSERFELDACGQVLATIDALGRRTRHVLDERGLPAEIHDAKGGVKRLVFNDWGKLTRYTDCSGNSTEMAYDNWGHLASSRNALGQTTRYQHDREGHLLGIEHPDGSQERYGYDLQGRLTERTDSAGQVTRWELAADGQPLRRVDALGQALQYRYDAHRRLVQLFNQNGDHYAFSYDALDRLISEYSFDGKRSHFQYDPAGQLMQVLELGDDSAADGDRIETRFERDAVGRLLAKLLKAPGQPLQATRFAYDANGDLLQASNAHSRVVLKHDAAGQLIEEQLTAAGLVTAELQIPLQGGGRQHTLRHRYDELGNRVATTLPDGRVVNMLVYGSGHVHQLNVDGQLISDFERDRLHRETARTQGQLRSIVQYDSLGRLQAQQVQRVGSSAAAMQLPAGRTARDGAAIQRQYRYDAAGQISQLQDWRRSVSYSCDAVGQLLRANEERFAFDPAHNLLPGKPAAGNAGRVQRNRLLVFEDQRFTYDTHGRLAIKLTGAHTQLRLHWNAEHQLERSVLLRQGRPSIDTGYAYDPFGRRLYKAPLDAQGRPIADRATWFVWDGDRLLQELKTFTEGPKPSSSLTQTYVYEPDSFVPLAQLRSVSSLEAGVGTTPARPLRVRPGQATAASTCNAPLELRYYHCDQIGTPRELTTSDGRIAWQATYRAWGSTALVEWEATTADAANAAQWQESRTDMSDLQPMRFQGQYFDVETGLHYNRFRYYDPDCGRYITLDPIGLAGGINPMAFVANPGAWTDVHGLAGDGGAYMFEYAKGGKYIGKGPAARMAGSMATRKKPNDCLIGAAHVDTGGDNELGKMVEYKAMMLSGFKEGAGRGAAPDGFANAHLSGKAAWDANPGKQAAATLKATELIAKFEASKIPIRAARCK